MAIVRALLAMGEAAEKDGGTFVIEGYKLKTLSNSPNFYIAKYDEALGYDDKVSLGIADEQEAKTQLATLVAQELGGEISGSFAGESDLPVEVVVELYLLSNPKRNKSWASTSGSTLRGLERVLPGVTVGEFSKRKQKTLINELADGVAGRAMMVGSVSNCMILIKAAINWACEEDDDRNRLITVLRPPVLSSKGDVAAVLGVPEPEARNWHASLEQTAAFLRLVQDDEKLRRWALLELAFVCRADAAAAATSAQIDQRQGVYHLNPEGRRQEKHKYRPSLPLPPSLLAEISCWGEGCWVGEEVVDLRARFKAAGARLGLGIDFVPSSMRDFGATMLREAYVRYGCPVVPEHQHKMWMGHREKSINHLYGQFSPAYLLFARNAIECVLHDLDRLSGGVLFRNARAAGTLPPGPVVIDPEKLRGVGMDALSGKSGKPDADHEGDEGDKITAYPIRAKGEGEKKAWGQAVVIGSKRAKAGGIGSLKGRFCQVQASPDWTNERPDGIAARLLEQGFRIVEFWPEGDEGGKPQLFVVGNSAKLLSDEDGRRVCNSSWVRWVKGRRTFEPGAQAPMGMQFDGEVAPVVEVIRSLPLPPACRKAASKRRWKYDPR
ncbi:MAG: hypothetical protein WAP03_30150 [Methylorubrum rhodinum]|uniref:hypothetical protein n=1 Tax=Methylorubrum rhodinum TaxID=29428 RepID=UPI003BAF2CAA